MEKISSILPSNARISSVDLKEAGPVRSGQPHFGRGQSPVTLRGERKMMVTEVGNAYQRLNNKLAKQHNESQIVQRVSEDFFKNQAPLVSQAPADNTVTAIPSESLSAADFAQAKEEIASATLQAADESGLAVAGENLSIVA